MTAEHRSGCLQDNSSMDGPRGTSLGGAKESGIGGLPKKGDIYPAPLPENADANNIIGAYFDASGKYHTIMTLICGSSDPASVLAKSRADFYKNPKRYR